VIATAERSLDTATRPSPPEQTEPPPGIPGPTTQGGRDAREVAVQRLIVMVLHGKPRRAIAAFRALTVLCKFYNETFARIIELCRTGRPAIAAAAAHALVQARLAKRRHQDGRSPLLHL
jgi:hypothetical protein